LGAFTISTITSTTRITDRQPPAIRHDLHSREWSDWFKTLTAAASSQDEPL
jgi:hypothetical protein